MLMLTLVRREIDTLNDRLAGDGPIEGGDPSKGGLKTKGIANTFFKDGTLATQYPHIWVYFR